MGGGLGDMILRTVMKWQLHRPLGMALVALLTGVASPNVPAQGGVPAKLPLPADFPELSREGREFPNEPISGSTESEFTKLRFANDKLLAELSKYTPGSIARTFEERMRTERDIHMKLLLATIAAENGSEQARQFLERMAEATGHEYKSSWLSALWHLVYDEHPDEWVFDLIYRAVLDPRNAYLVEEVRRLTIALGRVKNPRSASVLIEMARRTNGSRESTEALGMLGDPRGIPICLEMLKHGEPSTELLNALGNLKAKDAVPTLLSYLYSSDAIKALGNIGDERAIEPLRQIVANGGEIANDPYTHAKRLKDRTFAARMALIKLEKEDPVARWIDALHDPSLEWAQRREAIAELASHPDPRAIPHLLVLVKGDPKGEIVNPAIDILSFYKYKAAVAGLIECFDADFQGKADWKRAYTPEMFKANIGRTLHKLTGRDFGADKAQWQKWWDDEGKNSPDQQ
jgi:hypothetical protein